MSEMLARLMYENPTAGTLVSTIRNGDSESRHEAVREVALVGVDTIEALGETYGGADAAAAKAAGEALRRAAHHAARPGASDEASSATQALGRLVGSDRPRHVRVEALHLLGCIGGPQAVPIVAAQLDDAAVREDARLALQRIPGRDAETALRGALRTVPAAYAPAIELSLQQRRNTMRKIGVRSV